MTGLRENSGGLVWFRGQDRSEWGLIPSIARPGGNLEAELTTIKRFKQSAVAYLAHRPQSGAQGDWEWIFLMQHHRAPTRLLDWSESPLVALFFAIQNPAHDDTTAAIWCLDPIALNKVAGHNRTFAFDILAFGIDPQLDDYLPDRVNEKVSKLNPVAAIGPRNSARMVAQAGTFTVIHAEAMPIETIDEGRAVWRYIIPSEAKSGLREELKILGISNHSLFPDLDRVADLVKGLVI